MYENDKKTILIVDDTAENIDLISDILSSDYHLKIALNGQKALEILHQEDPPILVLLDIMMPVLDGYETCKKIKDNPLTKNIEVIFVSAMDGEEDIVKGYEYGGSDFITRPVKPEELKKKVKLAIENREFRNTLFSEKQMATNTAMTAMVNISEYGVIMEFIKQSYNINSPVELAQELVNTAKCYDLESSVQIRNNNKLYHASSLGTISQLEQKFLYKLKDTVKIRERKEYSIINHDDITLLIKNMPENEDKRGRYRDNLLIIAEASNSRLKFLSIEYQIQQTIEKSLQTMNNFEENQQKYVNQSIHVLDDVIDELENSFLSYGLTDEQEQNLMHIVKSGVKRFSDNNDLAYKMGAEVNNIINSLKTCMKHINLPNNY